jgi:hypothetical protein
MGGPTKGVTLCLRDYRKQTDIVDAVSLHWLRRSSDTLDQRRAVPLGSSNYGPFLAGDKRRKCSQEFSRFRLPLRLTEVMNVWTANHERQRRIMATFTIDSENNIVAHTGPQASTDESQSFSNEKELANLTAEWPASRLVETWNSFAGVTPFDDLKAVKKFTSRKVAVTRILQAVQRLSPDVAPQSAPVATERSRSKKSATKASRRARAQNGAAESRANKKAEVIAMMKRAKGATLDEIMEETGWQKHAIRGFVSILGSKRGEKIEFMKNAAGERTYRIPK